jgi:polyhydroxyalkanoate synthesis regulator phasin
MVMGVDEIKRLVGCGKGWAEERALMALEFADQHARGELSNDEYKELLEDLIRTDVLDSEADDLAVKTALVGAVKAAMILV